MMYQTDAPDAYRRLWEHRTVLDRILGRRDPARRARLDRAAADVDRELAANIELATMFDQTHQAVVFENAEFARHRVVLEAEVRDTFTVLAAIYERMTATEDAMSRRGPANTLKPEDRAIIEAWEGDVRAAQRGLRSAASAPPPSLWRSFLARLPGGKPTVR